MISSLTTLTTTVRTVSMRMDGKWSFFWVCVFFFPNEIAHDDPDFYLALDCSKGTHPKCRVERCVLLSDPIVDSRFHIECFHMMSRPPYWCPKTMKQRPCWCPKPILWELNSFLMQTLSFVPINLHRCRSRKGKYFIKQFPFLSLNDTYKRSMLRVESLL